MRLRSSSIRFIRQTTDQIVKPQLDLQTRKIQKLKEKGVHAWCRPFSGKGILSTQQS